MLQLLTICEEVAGLYLIRLN